MIPKKIHYCWFGRNPLPEDAKKCIASWRKFMPEYEIIEWNEDNFDVNSVPYTAQAYAAKKYAFVSDYARFKILYEHGGIYFDTDVEVIKPFDDIVEKGPFMGFEINATNKTIGAINPGLGLGVERGHRIYKLILDYYSNFNFINEDGSYNMEEAVVRITTRTLEENGLSRKFGIQNIQNIKIYPQDFFNPFNDLVGKLNITKNTHSIHWYSKTWLNVSPFRQKISRFSHRVLGISWFNRFKKILFLNLK